MLDPFFRRFSQPNAEQLFVILNANYFSILNKIYNIVCLINIHLSNKIYNPKKYDPIYT